jgi:hypothetical protein
MQTTKLTVRVDEEALSNAKRYAERHGTNLTRLVNAFLDALADDELTREDTPILRQLTGSLEPSDARGEYGEFLERKYIGSDHVAHSG